MVIDDENRNGSQDPSGLFSDEQLEALAGWLDSRFVLPGTGIRFGYDGLLGLVPGIGDIATALLSAVLIADAWKARARKRIIVKMAANLSFDLLIGAVPIVGDLWDFGFKSNRRNIALLRGERRRMVASEGE